MTTATIETATIEHVGARAPAGGRRARRGRTAYLSGQAAEESVARHYARAGRQVAARRWRGSAGEIDLVVREGARLVFVEVKAAASFDAAAARLGRRQMDRLCSAAEEFAGGEPMGLLSEMRFDLALVNRRGEVRVIENAFGLDW